MTSTSTGFFHFLLQFIIESHKLGWYFIKGDMDIGSSILWRIVTIIEGVGITICVLALDVIVLLAIFLLIRWITIEIRTKKITRKSVVGIVVDKKYVSGYMTTMLVGKCIVPMHHPEQYNVYVQYGDTTATFDNKKLYKRYKKNSPISLCLITKYDKNDKIIEQNLELPG